MANYNLTAQQIKDTFEQLAQVSASIEGGVAGSGVLDGTGSRVTTLHATASNALNSVTSSFALTATSASYAANGGVTSIIAGTNVTISPVGGTGAVTINSSGGGGSVDTGSLLLSASSVDATITYTKGDGSTFQNIINNVAFSTEAQDLVITVKNTSGGTLAKGTAVHPVSVTGENVDVIAASNDSASAMPAIGLLSAELTNNSAGTCIIAGRETGIDTSGLIAGASVYVSTGGALTATKPTGSALIQNIGTAAKIDASDGEIIVMGSGRSNDLPNVTSGAVWVGNNDQVPTAVQTGSLSVATASMAEDLVSTANININSITASTATFTSASIGYLESVTGSAKIIGDAFIILNNDTPTQQYAGLVVQDSGSVLTTSSFQWDGGNNEWFLEYSDDGGVTAEHGIALFGPEYATKGSPTYLTNNKIPKSNGGHHLNDSSLTDNGSVVTATAKLVSTTELAVGQAASPVNFPSSYLYLDTEGFGNGYSGYQIVNQRSGSTSLAGQLEMTTFSGLDGSNPIFGNKFNNNYLWWTSENYPQFNVAQKLVAEQGMDLSGSIGINGSFTGSLDLNGAITTTGGVSTGTAAAPQNFPSNYLYLDTEGFGNGYSGYQIVNQRSGSTVLSGQLEMTTFSGLDASNPIFGNKFNNNYLWWTSENYPEFNVAQKLVAEQGMDLSGSIGLNGSFTGSLNLNGAIDATGNITGQNITANGYLYSVAGAVTSGTGLQAGYNGASGVVSIKNSSNGGLQFPTFDAFTNTTDFTQVFSTHRIQDTNPTGSSPAQPVAIELSSYTGKDGVYPVSQLRLGPNEGASGGNTVMWSSENYPWINFDKSVQFNSPVTSSANVDFQSNLSLPGITNVSASIAAASVADGFPYTGNAQITGSLNISGSVNNNIQTVAVSSNTASIDLSSANMFEITLADATTYLFDVTGNGAGKTATLIIKQSPAGTGDADWGSVFRWSSGVKPTTTTGAGKEDIYTFVTYNASSVYAVQTPNMSS